MIDNAMHRLLSEAADEAGWDEESMMLMATRFIDKQAERNKKVFKKFKRWLRRQVSFEAAANAAVEEPSEPTGYSTCANCGKRWPDDRLNPIQDHAQRVAPEEENPPSGECPNCGALCYPVRSPIVEELTNGQ